MQNYQIDSRPIQVCIVPIVALLFPIRVHASTIGKTSVSIGKALSTAVTGEHFLARGSPKG